mmetsp:Transcript_9526/g.14282  ORF Transcript_9526/g.14282 Transcript_9526/m.14282 type:complete len:208 (+) Transcript_9526:135-758(+)
MRGYHPVRKPILLFLKFIPHPIIIHVIIHGIIIHIIIIHVIINGIIIIHFFIYCTTTDLSLALFVGNNGFNSSVVLLLFLSGHLFLVLLHHIHVSILQFLQSLLESLLRCLDDGFNFFNLGLQIVNRKVEVSLQLSLLISLAELNLECTACRLQILSSEAFQRIVVSSSLVIFQCTGISIFQGRESLNTIFGTNAVICLNSAINLGD